MLYEYRAEDGRSVERDYPMGQAPERVEEGGVVYRRAYGGQSLACRADRHFTALSQPRAQRVGGRWVHANPCARRFDGQGRPQFASMAEVREYQRASHDVSEMDGVEYD